jgi:membrane associated rhomboid family serine protease
MPTRRRRSRAGTRMGAALQGASGFILLMALVKGVEILSSVSLAGFGIRPRETIGLIGILFAPLLHASPAHLLANAGPLFFLLVILLMDPRYRPGATLAWIWSIGGLGTWILGRNGAAGQPTVHIGASSLIYGLVAYLITSGFRMRSWRALILSLVIGLLYGGIFHGVLPADGPVSWEGHLAGAVAGVWAADRQHR